MTVKELILNLEGIPLETEVLITTDWTKNGVEVEAFQYSVFCSEITLLASRDSQDPTTGVKECLSLETCDGHVKK